MRSCILTHTLTLTSTCMTRQLVVYPTSLKFRQVAQADLMGHIQQLQQLPYSGTARTANNSHRFVQQKYQCIL